MNEPVFIVLPSRPSRLALALLMGPLAAACALSMMAVRVPGGDGEPRTRMVLVMDERQRRGEDAKPLPDVDQDEPEPRPEAAPFGPLWLRPVAQCPALPRRAAAVPPVSSLRSEEPRATAGAPRGPPARG
ncbi:MAG: hypothetical protein SF028_05725 [Candidatus Sumerlaeia bacterium]|nr:hypothetical protein [Candidatus Sumerlaeia bacterium]